MIAKITRGGSARGLAEYLHGPGRADEHTWRNEKGVTFAGGKVIAGTVPLADPAKGKGWAKDFQVAHSLRPGVTKNVWHCSLRAAPTDRRLSDAEWTQIGHRMAAGMGYAEHPWVLVRHADDHVHIAVSRVSHEGAVWKGSHDRYAVRRVMREVEARHGLVQVPDVQQAPGPQTRLTQGEHRRAQRTREVPGRAELAITVRAARDLAAGTGRVGFETELDRAGVSWRVNVASTGRVSGYSFATGEMDTAGVPVAFTASQLDQGLSWAKLGPVLDGPRLALPVVDERWAPRKRFELPGTYKARRLALNEDTFRAQRSNAVTRERAGQRQFWAERPVIDPAKTAAELRRTEEAATARQREHTPATTSTQATLWQNGSPAARLAGLSYPVDPKTGRRPVQNPALRRVLEEEVAEATRQPITPGLTPHQRTSGPGTSRLSPREPDNDYGR